MPRVRTHIEAVSPENGPTELINSGSENLKLGLAREVGSPKACLGFEAWPSDPLGFAFNSTFEVGSSSGANTMPGPHDKLNELKGDGLDPKGLGYQVEVGSTSIDHALSADEILGSGDTLMVHRSTVASRLDWESVDVILRASWCEFSDVPIKVHFLTALIFPSLLFSCHFKREGFGVRLLGLYGDDSRVESGGALGLKAGADCGAWEDDGEKLVFDGGESCVGEKSLVIGGWRSEWDGSGPQREEEWAKVDHGGDDTLDVTPIRMVSGLIEEGKKKIRHPSDWVMEQMKNLANL